MPSKPLKGAWEVVGGIVPGTPIPKYTKEWFYLVEDFLADVELTKGEAPGTPGPDTRFMTLRSQAEEYARELTEPAMLNWVQMTWIWY